MAEWIAGTTALITLCGLGYLLLALWGARAFVYRWRGRLASGYAPPVTILKPVRGVDARMYAGFVSHCQQVYAGVFEIVFGVSSLEDAAVAEVERLCAEFPRVAIRLVVCPQRLGASGKVSNLVQMLAAGTHEHCVINDSYIAVSPRYLARVMECFTDDRGGLVTAPYLGRTAEQRPALTLWARLEALGIATDFLPGVLAARMLEGGLRFGLGSTLAVRRAALEKAGGLEALVDYLADDYEMGARVAAAGYRVELCPEVVETSVPGYGLRGYWDHQMRWARSTRDSRRMGYVGLGITYAVPWALATVVASGAALWSFSLLCMVLLTRMAVALTVGVGILKDGQVLRDLWLVPLRDVTGLVFWVWSFAGDTVVWRGEVFRLRGGRIERVSWI